MKMIWGINRQWKKFYKLLQLARSAELFEPVVSEVVVCEFIEHCRKGLNGVVYSEEEIDDFFRAVEPVLNFENIRRIGIGKELWVHIKDLQKPIEEYLYNLFYENTGERKDHLINLLTDEGKKISETDIGDIHVMYAAIEHNCDIIITDNKKHFPKRLGKIEIIRPRGYYEYLVGESM